MKKEIRPKFDIFCKEEGSQESKSPGKSSGRSRGKKLTGGQAKKATPKKAGVSRSIPLIPRKKKPTKKKGKK